MLHKALADSVRWGDLPRNPASLAAPPKPVRQEMKVWSPEQLRTFVNATQNDRLAAAWLLLVTTGMRRGEVLGLAWEQVDFTNSRLAVVQSLSVVNYHDVGLIQPKTTKGRRSIALDPATVAALQAHRIRQLEERLQWGEGWHDSDLVFTRENGTTIHPQRMTSWFEQRSRDAGLPKIRLHDLRHSYATAALAAGVPAKVVSERLGHASVMITLDTYSHILPSMQEDGPTQWRDLFSKARKPLATSTGLLKLVFCRIKAAAPQTPSAARRRTVAPEGNTTRRVTS